ncbi:hypothetical protein BDW69DRAFT_17490 [Aspergillus filifer]
MANQQSPLSFSLSSAIESCIYSLDDQALFPSRRVFDCLKFEPAVDLRLPPENPRNASVCFCQNLTDGSENEAQLCCSKKNTRQIASTQHPLTVYCEIATMPGQAANKQGQLRAAQFTIAFVLPFQGIIERVRRITVLIVFFPAPHGVDRFWPCGTEYRVTTYSYNEADVIQPQFSRRVHHAYIHT